MSNEELLQAIKVILDHRIACLESGFGLSTTLQNFLDALVNEQTKRLS